MTKKIGVAETVKKIVDSAPKNNQIEEFINYADSLRQQGLLKEDTYDWPNDFPTARKTKLFNIKSNKTVFNQA